MSRDSIISLIEQLEDITNYVASRSSLSVEEINEISGQCMGIIMAIKEEFSRHGISTQSPHIARLSGRMDRKEDFHFTLNAICDYFRSRVNRL